MAGIQLRWFVTWHNVRITHHKPTTAHRLQIQIHIEHEGASRRFRNKTALS